MYSKIHKISGEINRQEYEKLSGQTFIRLLKQKILNIIARFMLSPTLRIWIYRAMGVKIGKNCYVGLDSYLDDQFPELIEIEDHVVISFRVIITVHDDTTHIVNPVRIRKGAYIGVGAIILSGVIIGQNAIIGAGAVVTKSIPDNTVAVGVPAKVIRRK